MYQIKSFYSIQAIQALISIIEYLFGNYLFIERKNLKDIKFSTFSQHL